MSIFSRVGDLYLEKFSHNNRLERIWKLAQVDFRKRYYNDKFGLLWALINPLTQIAIYYFVFTKIFQRGGSIPNFALYLFCGLIVWIAFSQATSTGMRILYTKKYLIENIQFNWLDLYYTHLISISIGMLFNFFAYFIGLLIMGVSIGKYWYLFPIVFLTWYLLSFAITIILSILRPVFDDIAHIWKILVMIGFWISGIFFPGEAIVEMYPLLGFANPFLGIILNTRACLLEQNELFANLLAINFLFSLVLLLISLFAFKKYSQSVIEKL